MKANLLALLVSVRCTSKEVAITLGKNEKKNSEQKYSG